MKYNYVQAPLPFQGQKRKFQKDFKEALNGFSSTATYVDLFGGSGFLSHTVKQHHPDAKVVYNDFDGYTHRLENVDNTNAVLRDFREILKNVPDGQRVTGAYRDKIIERVKQEPGFVDYITLSSSVLFSMNYATNLEELEKQTLYSKVRQSDYKADGYLDGVNRVKKDYRDLFAEYRNTRNVVYLLDPPYLSTDVSTYNRSDYWKLTDYLNVLKCLEDSSYFYFTSNKSQIVELCDWMELNGYCRNPFEGATTVTRGTQLNHNSRYNDIMIYKNL